MTKIIAVDTETTDTDIRIAGICQLGAVLSDFDDKAGKCMSRETLFSSYSVPSAPMTKGAAEVHGITPDKYQWAPSEWITLASLDLIIREIKENECELDEQLIIAGQNLMRFDLPLMSRLYEEGEWQDYPTIDTLVLGWRIFPDEDVKLGPFYEWFVDKPAIDAHDAAADAHMVIEIVEKLVDHTGMSLKEMADWSKEAVVWEKMPFGKYKGKKIKDVPKSYFNWMKTNFNEPSPDLEKTINFILGYE